MGPDFCKKGPFNVKRIAIIGAGPTGIAAAKYLLAENVFDKIDIFEQQAEVGGVWNYTPLTGERIDVPQVKPAVAPDKPIKAKVGLPPVFSNPMYNHLNTNIPKNLMQFSDQDFPPENLLYPAREDVRDYLLRYSQGIRHLITFSTQVEDISIVKHDTQERWNVATRSIITEQTSHNIYDAVVIANGHYSVPYIPSVPGIEEFNKAYPSVISHAKIYRSSDAFVNKRTIVVGSGPSGLDIGTQISIVCQKPLLNSVRNPPALKLGHKEEVPAIAEYLVEGRSVRFEDGRTVRDIDAIVYCTGYLWSYPFFKSLDPPLVTTGRRVVGIWQQLFNISHPTLAFTALSQKVVPFPLSECQGATMAKVWANKLALPSEEEMLAWEKSKIAELGDGSAFHVLGYPRDAEYINFLHDWVMTAEKGTGKEPPFWGQKEQWVRNVFQDIRKRFVETGATATTMEELGFDFENF